MAERPGLLLVGGGGGFVGRHVLPELVSDFRVRSVHRHAIPAERAAGVEWIAGDVATIPGWDATLADVDLVVNLAWYRTGSDARFGPLADGLSRLLAAARRRGVRRFVHLSVPPAPPALEQALPYLFRRRRFDADLAVSGLSFRILRPTMLFGRGDVLLGVMLRQIERYGVFPMFGDGAYHLTPLWAGDLARRIRRELDATDVGTVDLAGPRRYAYRELTDLLFAVARRKPRYWRMTERSGARLAGLLEALGSRLLYRYEVEWLTSDLLGLPADPSGDPPLRTVEDYLGVAPRVPRPEAVAASPEERRG